MAFSLLHLKRESAPLFAYVAAGLKCPFVRKVKMSL
jgi:hypothetical protein